MSQSGYYCLGAHALGADLGAGTAVVVRIKNLGDVVAQQGGALGKLAGSIAPGMVSETAYQQIRQQLIDGFAQKGVQADVQVVSDGSAPSGDAPGSDFLAGAAVGAAGVGTLLGLWKLISWLVSR